MRSGALACLGKNRTMAKRGKQKSQRSGRHRGGLKSKGKRGEAEAARVESLGPSAVFVAELERVQDCSDMLGKAGLMSTEKMFSFELDGTSSSAAQEDGDVRMYSKKNHHRRMALRADVVVQRWIRVFFTTFGPRTAAPAEGEGRGGAIPTEQKAFDPLPEDLRGVPPSRPARPAQGSVAKSADGDDKVLVGGPRYTVPQNECIEALLKFAKAIFTPSDFDYAEVREIVETDFVKDAGIADGMSFEQFENSLFELVDTWTDGISAIEYRFFLEKLFYRTTQVNSVLQE